MATGEVRRGPMAALGTALTILVGLYAAVCLLLWVFEERLVFLPNVPGRALDATPRDAGLAFEDVSVTASDGVRLHAWWIPASGTDNAPRRALIHFHGNAGNIGHRLEMLRLFHALGVDVLLFDYRGYGRSEGAPGEAGMQRDAEAAWAYVTGRGIAAGRIVLHGQSMGAAFAAWLAARREPAALIVESGFTSIPDMAGEIYPWLPGRWLTGLKLDTRRALAEVRCPVLVIHSTADEIIPYSHAERLYAAAGAPKQMLTIDGDHNSGFWTSRDAYVAGVRDFLATLP